MGRIMWQLRGDDGGRATCPACGRFVVRTDAREYDKHGDRWRRDGKTFEYLCKSCHDALCHQRRDDLESLLVEINAGRCSTREFLERYWSAVVDRYGPLEEH